MASFVYISVMLLHTLCLALLASAANVLAWKLSKAIAIFYTTGLYFLLLHLCFSSTINKAALYFDLIWSKVKPSPASPGAPGEQQSQAWEVVTEGRFLGRYQPRVGGFSLPVWAVTWKTMIFVFRQQKPWWDREWPCRPPPEPQDKTPQLLALETQVSSIQRVHY